MLSRIREKLNEGIFISSLTIAELEYGVENSNRAAENRIALLKFLSVFTIVPFSDKDAIPYGIIKRDLQRKGQLIGAIDMLLAAQAISNNFIFVTNNTKEFERIKNLKVENWA